jgi:amidohydrolase
MSTYRELNIPEEILAIKTEIVENRRWFHAHPELPFKEFETAKKIAELLRGYGISEVFENIATTGVVALIRGARPGLCIALRADIDALPVQETAEVPYRSLNEGCMHACGHDGHMAGLLGAARILNAQKDTLSGCVKLVFQPAEEGFGGAAVMIREGVLNDGPYGPKVDAIYGIHLWSFEALGSVCCSDGPVMAASDKFTIEVKGKGGHGAAPQVLSGPA